MSGSFSIASHLTTLFSADQQIINVRYTTGAPGGPQMSNGPGGPQVGWGGAHLPQDYGGNGRAAPWFGRSRKQGSSNRQRGPGGAGSGSGALGPSSNRGGGGGPGGNNTGSGSGHGGGGGGNPSQQQSPSTAPDALSVDEAVALVKRLPRDDPLPESLFRALPHLDSRAAALLLKDLSKSGADERAIELFDRLRALPDGAPLRALCDVYTYTAMISLCIYQQNVERAMELLGEMRARGVERNVHTYTALMNVCIKVGGRAAAWGAAGRMGVLHGRCGRAWGVACRVTGCMQKPHGGLAWAPRTHPCSLPQLHAHPSPPKTRHQNSAARWPLRWTSSATCARRGAPPTW